MAGDDDLTMEAEARRFEQIRSLERQLREKDAEVEAAKARVKDLQKEADAFLSQILSAARNEGDLPLFAGEP